MAALLFANGLVKGDGSCWCSVLSQLQLCLQLLSWTLKPAAGTHAPAASWWHDG